MFSDQLDREGLTLAGGWCPGVCFGGYIQGGGTGPLNRFLGYGADQTLGATLVTANGTVMKISQEGIYNNKHIRLLYDFNYIYSVKYINYSSVIKHQILLDYKSVLYSFIINIGSLYYVPLVITQNVQYIEIYSISYGWCCWLEIQSHICGWSLVLVEMRHSGLIITIHNIYEVCAKNN